PAVPQVHHPGAVRRKHECDAWEMSAGALTAREPAEQQLAEQHGTTGIKARRGSLGWMVLPALLFFAVFAVLPLLGVVALSFTNWDGIGAISVAGMDNWLAVLSD